MSVRLDDKSLIGVSLMLRFDSVGKIKTANHIESYDWVKKWSKYIRTKCSFWSFRFDL